MKGVSCCWWARVTTALPVQTEAFRAGWCFLEAGPEVVLVPSQPARINGWVLTSLTTLGKYPRSLQADVVVSVPRWAVCLTSRGLQSSLAVLASPSWIVLLFSLRGSRERFLWVVERNSSRCLQANGCPPRAPLLPPSYFPLSSHLPTFSILVSARFYLDLFSPPCSLHISCGAHEYYIL